MITGEYDFIRRLHIETVMCYSDVSLLVAFIKNRGNLEKAILIYNDYGYKGLMRYKKHLIRI